MKAHEKAQFLKLCEVLEIRNADDTDLCYVMAMTCVRIQRLNSLEGLDWTVMTGQTLPQGDCRILIATIEGDIKEVYAGHARMLWQSANHFGELCNYSHWKKMPSHPQIPRTLAHIH